MAGSDKPLRFPCGVIVFRSRRVRSSHEIRATVHRQQVSIVEIADTGIPAAAAADGTQAADAFEILLQHGGIVIEVTAVTA